MSTFPGPVALVAGDKMLDRYLYGEVTRTNPENPSAPLFSVRNVIQCGGGSSNVSNNLQAMGAYAHNIGGVGGECVKHRLVTVGAGELVARFDEDVRTSPVDISSWSFQNAKKTCNMIVVADYGKGAINHQVAGELMSVGVPIFVNSKPAAGLRLWNRDCVMLCNMAEFKANQDSYKSFGTLFVTQGQFGASLFIDGKLVTQFPSRTAEFRSVVGAGDTVLASFSLIYSSFLKDLGPLESAQLAGKLSMYFAAVAVRKSGTSTVSFKEVLDYCSEDWPVSYGWVSEMLRQLSVKMKKS